ncbi:MAG: hydantoinase B/oxoprolinase family protein [Verrucomicrobia bacterium]|nr:hydantoinase B/oxoprolinase family protein [Verrucomicrobiota bacterium]
MNARGRWQFWIDRGGTFTDLVGQAPDGSLRTHKLLSENPGQYPDAAVEGIRRMLALAHDEPIPSDRIASVKMGTTVATNALLERKGARTALLINRGFADVLRIGTQQRPRLFDLRIALPEQIYEKVVEFDGRFSAEGEELEPSNLDGVRSSLESLLAEGIRSIAIVCIHGYRYPKHERVLAELARNLGFDQVSSSHEVSQLIKLTNRGDTTVVDAYLSPVLARYVEGIRSALPGVRLLFMQSHGGLTDADQFKGKDAILSGPAGGMVGAAKVGLQSGCQRIIGFDMGGTSTDVSHFAGEYERRVETEVAGVRICAPMMHIHTVAAGGGSICRFDGSRLRVGPESAGANPGPACYRRNGPLTVTDCNVLLGRLHPNFFPRIFGPAGDLPIDVGLVCERFKELAAAVGDLSPERLASGFLRIAVENVANAIKKISVARGYDVSRYTLVTFGGAGGQHACAVADALGMDRVFIHRFAGVLSAYGMGLAELRVLKECSVEKLLTPTGIQEAERVLADLEVKAKDELRAQTGEIERVTRKFNLRYEGTDTPLAVEAGSMEAMEKAFLEAHRARFGFVMDPMARQCVIDSVSLEAISGSDVQVDDLEELGETEQPEPVAWVDATFAERRYSTPVFERAGMGPGVRINGPAIIVEATTTTVVEEGWRAEVTQGLNLLLTRVVPRRGRVALGTTVDPMLLELFNNMFMSIAEQMGAVLQNSAYSVNIKERLDFSCALFDAEGKLVANAPHVPVHLGSMGEAVRAIIRRRGTEIQPGDVYALNDPFSGGTHLPDITVISPVFGRSSHPLFWLASRGHHADIGGLTPGSMPPESRTIREEGVMITDFLLVKGGVFREAEFICLLGSGQYPARNPAQNLGDIRAQIAANEKGDRELNVLVDQFGFQVVQAYMGHVRANASERVRQVIDRLKPGRFVQKMDFGGEIRVQISVDTDARTATVDFTGTSAEQPGNFNAPSSIVYAAVLYVFRTLVNEDIPLNDGCLEALKLVIPPNSMLAPKAPAAVAAGNVETSQAVTNALFGALGLLAAAQGTMNNLTFGNSRYQYYETICGGAGAGPGFNGASAVHTHMTNSRLTDPEVLELRYPVLIDAFRIRRGSGGRGRWSGGDGVVRRIVFRDSMMVAVLANNRVIAPFGLEGGHPGMVGKTYLQRANGGMENLGSCARRDVRPGDAVVIETPGGGGFGAPQ